MPSGEQNQEQNHKTEVSSDMRPFVDAAGRSFPFAEARSEDHVNGKPWKIRGSVGRPLTSQQIDRTAKKNIILLV